MERVSPVTARLWLVAAGLSAGGLAAERRPLLTVSVCVGGVAIAGGLACRRPRARRRARRARDRSDDIVRARLGLSSAGQQPVAARPRIVARGAALILAACAAGSSVVALRMSALDRSDLATVHRERAALIVEVLDDPVVRGGSMRALVAVSAAAREGASAVRIRGVRALLSIEPIPRRPPRAGDRLRVDASLREEDARWARRRGIAVRAYAQTFTAAGRTASPVRRAAEAVRGAVRAAAGAVPGAGRGMLEGLLIGDTSRLDPAIAEQFRITGLAHLTAVSGANVALVLALIGAIARAAGAGPRVSLAILAASVLVFSAAARFEPSVVRAGAMAAVALGARAAGARADPRHTLVAAVVLVLLGDPLAAWSLGFQLSVLAPRGLLTIAPRLAERLGSGPVASAAALTLGATLAVTPLLVVIVGRLSLVAVPANLVVAPLAAPATLLGATGAVGALVWRPLRWLAAPAHLPLMLMRTLSHAFASLPAPEIAVPLPLATGLSMATCAIALRAGRRRVRIPVIATAALLLAAVIASGPVPRGLIVTMLDVGQGEAIVVRAGERTMLIDGGGDPALLRRRLTEHAVARVDLLVLSHPHADHLDGLTAVAGRMHVGRALDPQIDQGEEGNLASHAAVTGALRAAGVPIDRAVAGATYRLGPALVEVLWPPRQHLVATSSDVNNNSVVLRATHGEDRVLFAGETQEEAQEALLTRPGELVADVLKVSHHGSKRMVPAFYRATRAAIALIPVGVNRYGHPAAETLVALQGMRVLRSDLHGTVTVGLDGVGGAAVRAGRA